VSAEESPETIGQAFGIAVLTFSEEFDFSGLKRVSCPEALGRKSIIGMG
jgi:hypothetical protein